MYCDLFSGEGLVNACRFIFSCFLVDSYQGNLWTQDCLLAQGRFANRPVRRGEGNHAGWLCQ
jgi:hypothetical protein